MKTTALILASSLIAVTGCGTADLSVDEGAIAGAGYTSQEVTAGKCPIGATVQGIDVSTYQGSVNWAAVKASGRAFGIARVSDGLHYPDSTFAANWAHMKAAGVVRGAYQFFRPGQDPVAQANMVVARVGKLGAGDLPVMLDMEVTDGQSAATITARIHSWANTIKAGTGKTPMIYSGAYFWDSYVRSADFAGWALNVAWYGTNCPGVPNAWKNWTFHQYNDNGRIPGISGNVDVDVFNGTLAQLHSFAGTVAPPPPNCHKTAGPFTWSCNGPLAGQACTKISEPSDPHTWNDNYLCAKEQLGIRWSSAGPVAGMRCTRTLESADPQSWSDNYLCVPQVSPYHFSWSSHGPISGDACVQWFEPADPNTWSDNYLCWNNHEMAVQKRGPFGWSSAGPIAGMHCTGVNEPADPAAYTWKDNFFCSTTDLGMKWSNAGPIAGMTCTNTHEAADPHTWNDNYLCLPPTSPYHLKWSSAGPIAASGNNCIAWYEGADPNTWNDNYMCW